MFACMMNKSMKKTLLAFITLLGLAFFSVAHPFYVSITQIDYKNQALQITLKIFVSDLQDAMLDAKAPELYLGEEKEHASSEKYITDYIHTHLQISVNDVQKKYTFVGKEVEQDAIWVYFEIPNISGVTNLEVRNTLLIEKFEGQTNLVNTDIKEQKKSLILNKSTPQDKLSF